MENESYRVEPDEVADLPIEKSKEATQKEGDTAPALLAFTRLLALGKDLPPFHPEFKESVGAFVDALEALRKAPHRPSEIHILRQEHTSGARFLFIGPTLEPMALARGFGPKPNGDEIETCLTFLRESKLALLTFETQLSPRSISRLIQLILSLNPRERPELRSRLRFIETKGVFALHVEDIEHATSPDSPWLERIAAARVRSLLMRLPNPAHLETWLHSGGGVALIRDAIHSIGAQTSLSMTFSALVSMPAPGQYANLLELVLQTLTREDLLAVAEEYSDPSKRGTKATQVALSLGVHLHKIGEPNAAHLLESLYREGGVALDDLPDEVRRSIRISTWTKAFDSKPFFYLQRLANVEEAQAFMKDLNALGHVYRDLVADHRFGNAELVVRFLGGLIPVSSFPERRRLLEEFFERLATVSLNETADAYLDSNDRYFKAEVLTFLTTSGHRGLPSLLTLLGESESAEERGLICNAIIRMGRAIHPLLISQFERKILPWYVRRNLLFILGKLGIPEGVEEIRQALMEGDPRVQKEAANTLIRIQGEAAWPPILDAMMSQSEFRLEGAQLLSQDGCNLESFRSLLLTSLEFSLQPGLPVSTAILWTGFLMSYREQHGALTGANDRIKALQKRVKSSGEFSNDAQVLYDGLKGLL